jgi:Sec-independent protein translocase protein TatA
MLFHPVLALFSPEIIGIIVLGALVVFGYDKVPKLARSLGSAKKEFMVGQMEADEAAAKAREEIKARAATAATEPPTAPETEPHS